MATIKQRTAFKEVVRTNSEMVRQLEDNKDEIVKFLKLRAQESKKNLWSYIYIVKCGDYCKIGYTFDMRSRFDSFKTANPYEMSVEFAEKVPNAKQIEVELHERYINKKYRREWYMLDNNDIQEIKEWVGRLSS